MDVGAEARDAPNAARLEALHLTALCGIAVAHPIFDVVGRSPEFFIAHDAGPADLLALVAFLCLGVPAGCALLAHLAGLCGGWRWRRRAAAALIGGLAGAVALAAFKPLGSGSYTATGPTLHFLHVLLPHEPWTCLADWLPACAKSASTTMP